MRQSYTGAAREGSERPSGRRAALALPAMRKLALLAALWMRGARVFVRQSSETPGALESCMRHVARAACAMVLLMRLCRCIVVMVACGVCFRLVGAHACTPMYVLLAGGGGEAFVPGRGTLVDV